MSAAVLPLHHPEAIARAADLLRHGELVILPTETVYGITARLEARAIAHLYEIKGRRPESALPLLISDPALLETLARPSRAAQRLAQRYWPGPLTLILPPGPDLPPDLKATRVALRHPNTPALWPLLELLGGAVVVSWASRPGHPPAITAAEAVEEMGNKVALILDGGPCALGIPSTIVNCLTDPPTIERRGSILAAKVLAALEG